MPNIACMLSGVFFAEAVPGKLNQIVFLNVIHHSVIPKPLLSNILTFSLKCTVLSYGIVFSYLDLLTDL